MASLQRGKKKNITSPINPEHIANMLESLSFFFLEFLSIIAIPPIQWQRPSEGLIFGSVLYNLFMNDLELMVSSVIAKWPSLRGT